jgi:hypothetical protein
MFVVSTKDQFTPDHANAHKMSNACGDRVNGNVVVRRGEAPGFNESPRQM